VRPGRRTLAVLGAVAIVLALGAAFLAADVRRSAAELRRGDAAFDTDRSSRHSWSFESWTPWHAGERSLAVGDDLRFRHAAQRFRLVQRDPLAPRAILARRNAERALVAVERVDPDRSRRAETENLLGVLAFTDSRHDEAAGSDLLQESIDRFTKAVAVDPGNEDAKFNLELALTLYSNSGIPQGGNGRGNQAAAAGAVASPPGSGY
jgi:hypothetical protein